MAKHSKTFLEYINSLKFNGNFIPILDEEPVEAARCLIYPHLERAINIIATSLTFVHTLMSDRDKFIIAHKEYLCYDIISRVANVIFYSKMYEEMQSIYKEAHNKYCNVLKEFSKEYLYDTSFRGCTNKPKYIRPISVFINHNEKLRKHYDLNLFKGYNAIDGYRRMYLFDRHSYDKFPVGAPKWYAPSKRIIYQKYDLISRKHVRITTDEKGQYSYYVAYISDRWVEVKGVPNEVKDIIDSILKGRRDGRSIYNF